MDLKSKYFNVIVMFSDGSSQLLSNLNYERMKLAVLSVGKYWITANVKQLD